MEHTHSCGLSSVFEQFRLYRLNVIPSGLYQVESYDRALERWFPLYIGGDRAATVVRLNWLLASAQGEPRIVCPHCGQPLPYPDVCYVGEDGLYYCSRGCEIDRRTCCSYSPRTEGFFSGVLTASLLWAFGVFCWWHITLQGGVR